MGFLGWEIFQGSYGAREFSYFLRNKLRPLLISGCIGLLDNSSTHQRIDALGSLDEVFQGLYEYVPGYSPHLKPIEKGFGNVKGRIRGNPFAAQDPIGAINEAFNYYATDGPGSAAGKIT